MDKQAQVNQVSFDGQNFYCGIDVHKKSWTVTIETNDIRLKTFSQNPDPALLFRYLEKHYPGGSYIAGYEAGYFGFGIQRKLSELGIECQVLHAADIPTTHKEKEQKQDPRDSKKIARTIRTDSGNSIWIPSKQQECDRQLIRTRKKLVSKLTRVKTQVKSFLVFHGITFPPEFSGDIRWSSKFVKWLDEIQLEEENGTHALRTYCHELEFLRSELARVDRLIKRMASSKRYESVFQKLIKISGIGYVTAMTFLTEIGDITRFKDTDNFRSYVGVIPSSHSSGENDRQGKITNRANVHLRSLVMEMAWIAVRRDSYYLTKFQHHCKKMKANKAIVRVANSLVNRIYYIMKMEQSIC